MTTSPTTQTEEYEGKLKCKWCDHKQRDHKMAREYCLVNKCDCLQFAKPGGLR